MDTKNREAERLAIDSEAPINLARNPEAQALWGAAVSRYAQALWIVLCNTPSHLNESGVPIIEPLITAMLRHSGMLDDWPVIQTDDESCKIPDVVWDFGVATQLACVIVSCADSLIEDSESGCLGSGLVGPEIENRDLLAAIDGKNLWDLVDMLNDAHNAAKSELSRFIGHRDSVRCGSDVDDPYRMSVFDTVEMTLQTTQMLVNHLQRLRDRWDDALTISEVQYGHDGHRRIVNDRVISVGDDIEIVIKD